MEITRDRMEITHLLVGKLICADLCDGAVQPAQGRGRLCVHKGLERRGDR